jgi:hypothetical protein
VETKDGKVEFGSWDFVTFPKVLSGVWDMNKSAGKHYYFPQNASLLRLMVIPLTATGDTFSCLERFTPLLERNTSNQDSPNGVKRGLRKNIAQPGLPKRRGKGLK